MSNLGLPDFFGRKVTFGQVNEFNLAYLKYRPRLVDLWRTIKQFKDEVGKKPSTIEELVIGYQQQLGRIKSIAVTADAVQRELLQVAKLARWPGDQQTIQYATTKLNGLFLGYARTVALVEERALFAEAGVCVFIDFPEGSREYRIKGMAITLIRKFMHDSLTADELSPDAREALVAAAAMCRPKA
jgi:hypothetical protein